MKKRFLLTGVIALMMSGAALNAQTSGTCGANLTWELTGTGDNLTLTISGTGDMTDYNYAGPWYYQQSNIKTLVINDGVTKIGNFAFADCRNLTGTLTIPNSVTSIGDYAFYFCWGLTSFTIPNSVISIGESAFWNCSSLTGTVTIPNSVASIGSGPFAACYNITAIDVDANNPNYSSDNGVLFDKNKTTLIQYPAGKIGAYTIPNSVTFIEQYAFTGCYGLTSVIIPNSIIKIKDLAFYGSSGLTEINVDVSNPNYSSVNGVLFNKNKTTLIRYPAGKTGAYTIPNSVTLIGHYAFYYCSSLTAVTIPNSVVSIGEWAFVNCSSLIAVTIPNSVTSIGQYAFYYCSALKLVIIGSSVTSIGDYAFHSCSSLTTVTIPNSVTSIGSIAFGYCTSLTDVYVAWETPPSIINSYVFWQIAVSNVRLYIPKGTLATYQAAPVWQDFLLVEDIAEVNNIYNDNLKLYPNPVKDVLRIENGELRITNVEILDLTGKQIVNGQWLNGKSINVANLPSGVYFLKIQTDNGVITRKFVKE